MTDGQAEHRGGQLIGGRVRLEERLGQGGIGDVWRASHLERTADVAVKLLAPRFRSALAESSHVASFLREATLTRRVDSPHVVRVIDCAYSPEVGPYIVMEMLAGPDLFEHIAGTGTLEMAEAAAIVAQLCEALEALHAADVFHRDVKPENVVLTRYRGRTCAKLIDFGIARDARAPAEVEEGIFGTPAYLSPERIHGVSAGGEAADLWALAVVAYQCLVGRVPFDDRTLGTVTMAIHRVSFRPPSFFLADSTPDLDAWFGRAFAPDPSDRFQTAMEMREGLVDAWSPFPLEAVSRVRESVPREAAA
jgi:serine/threonine-protein kinase